MTDGFSFPPELERDIFETTAFQHPPEIPGLLRVCRRVHTWIEPLLYRIMDMTSISDRQALLSARKSKPPEFLRNSVRNLFLVQISSSFERWYKELLSDCTETSNLVIMISGAQDELLLTLHNLPLQRLALSVSQLYTAWGLAMETPFISLTHLDLTQEYESERGRYIRRNLSWLASLPSLTHLALPPSMDHRDTFLQLPTQCPTLIVMIISSWSSAGQPNLLPFAQSLTSNTDLRVVVMMMGMGFQQDWQLGICGGDDYWKRAEMFVARKRAGEIERTSYVLEKSPS
ncbi:hypothetical protein C8R47DRAFT_1202586 [Mycena vitilis]|nr:hypothetical protein C8R47DRAFT_1202586 [Mycena vitilis]